MLTPHGALSWCDPEGAAVLGLSHGYDHRHLVDFVHSSDAAAVSDALALLPPGAASQTLRVRLRVPDGYMPADVSLRPRLAPDDSVQDIVALVQMVALPTRTGTPLLTADAQLYRALLNASDLHAGLIALDYRVLVHTPAFRDLIQRMYGTVVENGADLRVLVAEAPRSVKDRFFKAFCIALEGRSAPLELSVFGSGDAPVHLRGSCFPVVERGSMQAIAFVLRDETRAVEAHRERAQIVRALLTTVPFPMGLVELVGDDDQRLVFTNPEMRSLAAVSEEQLTGLLASELSEPSLPNAEVRRRWTDAYRRAKATGKPQTVTFITEGGRFMRGTGAYAYTTPAGDDRYAFVCVDETEQIHQMELLSERQTFIEHVAHTVPDLIFVNDRLEKRLVYENWPLHSFLRDDLTPEPFDACPFERYVHPDDGDAFRRHVEAVHALPDGTVAETELHVVRADGTSCHVRLRNTVLSRLPDGSIHRVLGIAQDVTERHHVEAALERLASDLMRANDALESRAADLEVARAAAEQAAEAKSAFLATMSHEIRTPLNGILGMTQILEGLADSGEHPLSGEQTECVDTIRASGQVLLSLINDILNVSKLDAGRVELERAPFDLHALARTTRQVAASLVPEGRPVAVCLELSPGVPRIVFGDEMRLRQVLLNLLSNAVKFTAKGAVTLRIALGDDFTVRFSVVDTGIGIAADVLPHLFQPFMQADVSTTRRYGGTGLGLAIAKGFVHLMGGSISVESTPGEGSTFRFDVALPSSESTPAAPHAAPVRDALPPTLRLLLVEDNVVNQKVALRMLERLGLHADVAENGRIALDRLAAEAPYDVVLMDLLMPEMNGDAAAEALRRMPLARQPYVIALTADITAQTAHERAHMDAVLSKPFTLDQLHAALWEAVHAREAVGGACLA